MDEITANIGIAILTVFGSGIVSALVSYKLNNRNSHRELLRQKAETAFLALSEYNHFVTANFLAYFPLLKGNYDYNAMLDQQIKSGSKEAEHGGFDNLKMIVDIYFPSAREALSEILKSRDEYNNFTLIIRQFWLEHGNMDNPDLIPCFHKVMNDYDQSIQDLKTEIIKAARLQSGVEQ